jgi:Tfp pilus assembly protein PilN
MKAVNLLPSDLRRAGASAGSDSGMGAYLLLGILAVAVVVMATWAVSAREVRNQEADVARLTAEAQSAEQQAAGLAGYRQTVKIAQDRETTVEGLASSRFDWARALRELSTTMPSDTYVTTMAASTSPAVAVGGSGGSTRGSLALPAIEISGCAPTQDDVARLMTRLRGMDGVEQVSLGSSEKADTAGASGSSGASGGGVTDCRQGSDRIPQFNLVVFYKGADGQPAATGTATTASTAAPAAPTGGTK